MKKILMVLFVMLFFSITNVEAQNYKLFLDKQEGIYYARSGGSLPYKSSQFSIYRFGDNIAYCIEPNKNITTYNYISTDGYIDLPYSDELKEELELIGYYGREYPGHDNVRYSMAAQALIWEKTGGQTVTFWTERYEQGNMSDVSKEKKEIMDLVHKHKILPNIPDYINAYVKKNIEIKDTNNVLDNFYVENGTSQDVYILDNTLYINPKKQEVGGILLRRIRYDDLNTLIFVGEDSDSSQTIGRLRFSKEDNIQITLNVDGPRLLIYKTDEKGNRLYVPNIAFKIKNTDTNEYVCENSDCRFLTDLEGVILTSSLDDGHYEIMEDENQIINGYAWNSKKIEIDVNYNSDIKWDDDYYAYIDLYFDNKEVSGKVELNKIGEEVYYQNNVIEYYNVPLSNIEFELYDDNDNLIDTIKTNEKGYAKYDDLKIGKYYLIEKTVFNNYIKDNKRHYFEIKQENQYQSEFIVKIDLKNYLKKGSIEIIKVDSETQKEIDNTLFDLYNEEGDLLLEKVTDDKGKIIISNLPLGKYYLKEKEANYNYQKNNEKIFFEIKENDQLIKIRLENNLIKGQIKINKKGEKCIIEDNDIYYTMDALSNITFDLYSEQDVWLESKETNEDGVLFFSDLPLGKYYIMEKNNMDYIDNNKKYFVELKKDNFDRAINISLDVENYLKKGILDFTKIDLETLEGIPNTTIQVFDEDNTLLLEKVTDEDGKILLSNLPIGKYYIKEKKANSLYQMTNEKIFFEILYNEVTKEKMINEKIIVKVPKTGRNDTTLINAISSFMAILGMGNIYVKRKTN